MTNLPTNSMPNYMNPQNGKASKCHISLKYMHVIVYFKKNIGIKSNIFIQNPVKTHQCASSVGG